MSIREFYQSVFSAWRIFKVERENHFGLEEPLFYNSWLCHQYSLPSIEINTFISSSVLKVVDLIDREQNKWFSVEEIIKQIERRSERIVKNVLSKLQT